MKKWLLLLLILCVAGCSSVAEAALTAEEELTVTQLHQNKAKLVSLMQRVTLLENLADGVTNETVPVQVAQLRRDIQTLIAARDAEIQALNVANDNAISTVEGTYETQIDALEGQISSLLSTL